MTVMSADAVVAALANAGMVTIAVADAGMAFPADLARVVAADVTTLADAELVTIGVAGLADAGMLFPVVWWCLIRTTQHRKSLLCCQLRHRCQQCPGELRFGDCRGVSVLRGVSGYYGICGDVSACLRRRLWSPYLLWLRRFLLLAHHSPWMVWLSRFRCSLYQIVWCLCRWWLLMIRRPCWNAHREGKSAPVLFPLQGISPGRAPLLCPMRRRIPGFAHW